MGKRTNWKQSWQYRRILEILDDYWLNCPDEAFVMVDMYFRHSDGSEQLKEITWYNPNIKTKESDSSAILMCAADLASQPIESFYNRAARKSAEFLHSIE